MPFIDGGGQATLTAPVVFDGVGVHSGKAVRLTLKPASENTGIVFIRTDALLRTGSGCTGPGCTGPGCTGPGSNGSRSSGSGSNLSGAARATSRANVIKASPHAVTTTRLGTTLSNADGVIVSTVEHLMAALAICGVDNVVAELNAAELPIMDGSAAPFVSAFMEAGVASQGAPRRRLLLREPVEVRDGDRVVRAEPAQRFSMQVAIDFADEACIGRQSVDLDFTDIEALRGRIAGARTFCRLSEVDALKAAGLCQGGSLENAVVVDGGEVKNPQGLRDPQEFVLHKALDLLGDLALIGAPLGARIIAEKPGHDLNTRLAAAIANAATQPKSPAATAVAARLSA